jgi:hypothetical protein
MHDSIFHLLLRLEHPLLGDDRADSRHMNQYAAIRYAWQDVRARPVLRLI